MRQSVEDGAASNRTGEELEVVGETEAKKRKQQKVSIKKTALVYRRSETQSERKV